MKAWLVQVMPPKKGVIFFDRKQDCQWQTLTNASDFDFIRAVHNSVFAAEDEI